MKKFPSTQCCGCTEFQELVSSTLGYFGFIMSMSSSFAEVPVKRLFPSAPFCHDYLPTYLAATCSELTLRQRLLGEY